MILLSKNDKLITLPIPYSFFGQNNTILSVTKKKNEILRSPIGSRTQGLHMIPQAHLIIPKAQMLNYYSSWAGSS